MSAGEASLATSDALVESDVASLVQIVGRIVRARVANSTVAEDLVQETLMKVLAAADRVEPGMLEPYAIVTARNLVASMWKEQDRTAATSTGSSICRQTRRRTRSCSEARSRTAISAALERLSERDRQHPAGSRGRRAGHRVAGRRVGSDRRGGRRAAEPDPGPAAGGVPPRAAGRRAADTDSVDRCCSPCPAATGDGSGRWMPPGTCSSATSAPS